MIYAYPPEATADNWLHDCLVAMIGRVHLDVAAGNPAPAWPNCIPPAYKTRLRKRHALGARLGDYYNAVAALKNAKRDKVLAALAEQNQINTLLSGATDCQKLSELPKAVRAPVRSLYEFAFTLLTDLGIRDSHYKIICTNRPQMTCPFCGMEYFDSPGGPREDADHYLAISIYPFAGANLRNLIPMGSKCNQRYKKTQNILFDRLGGRRRAFDPYGGNAAAISLLQSVPFGAPDGSEPKWNVALLPASPECETWDQVFKIRDRCAGILKPQFKEWLRPFAGWWKQTKGTAVPDHATMLAGLGEYVAALRVAEHGGRDFLRVPMFEMLHSHCVGGNQRLVQLLIRVVESGR